MNIRGVDHIGITVPDIVQATEFFVRAFDAVHLYDIIDSPIGGEWIENGLGVPKGTRIEAIRVLRIGDGANIELFDYRSATQQAAAVPSDMGYQHVALYVDDIDAAARQLVNAGATLMGDGPSDLPGNEAGEGCRFLYARTPWGSTVELVTYPSRQAYHDVTSLRKWTPEPRI